MSGFARMVISLAFAVCLLWADAVPASPVVRSASHRSITDRTIVWPAWEQWQRIALLKDYNSRIVILGTALLGAAAGIVGSFTLLRKRALMGDALSHATLPGIGLAFIIATAAGADGKSLSVLLPGATLTGLIGVGAILLIRNLTRLKEDAALGIVLSVFFGAGVSLLGVIQQMKTGHAAGLEAFVYGKTASMRAGDAMLTGGATSLCVIVCLMLFKELKLLCFDEGFAGSRGLPIVRLDMVLMALVVVVAIVGLQAVGLILMIALLVIPAAAARFWTEEMWKMALIASMLGAAGGMLGAAMSALFSRLPSGAMIVLVCSLFFLASLVFGTARGVLVRWVRRTQLNRRVHRQHVLRAMYEILESSASAAHVDRTGVHAGIPISKLLSMRSWSARRLRHEIRRAERAGFVTGLDNEQVCLTESGFGEAARLTRQHRLWELYLINYADIAPGNVDRDADAIEHVLDPDIVSELEALLHQQQRDARVPASPHELREGFTAPSTTAAGGT